MLGTIDGTRLPVGVVLGALLGVADIDGSDIKGEGGEIPGGSVGTGRLEGIKLGSVL